MAFTPTVGDKVVRRIVRLLAKFPLSVQRWLAGPAVTIDGNKLFPDVQLILRLLALRPPPDASTIDIPKQRADLDRKAYVFSYSEHVRVIEDTTIPTRSGGRRARVYTNVPADKVLGTVVYYHGGGNVLGSLESTDSICRAIAAQTALRVVSIDYRLAPEHKFPAGVEDSVDTYAYVRGHKEWGHLVAVAGDSAGGSLAAVVSNETKKKESTVPPPDFQLLLYPCTDLSVRRESYKTFATGYMLTTKQVDWYVAQYVRTPDDLHDPRVSPLLEDLYGAPPTHLTIGGYDVLRDECLAYVDKLKESGVNTTLQLVEGHIHAFANSAGVSPSATPALQQSIKALEEGMKRAAEAKRQ